MARVAELKAEHRLTHQSMANHMRLSTQRVRNLEGEVSPTGQESDALVLEWVCHAFIEVSTPQFGTGGR